jgi:hypothetical protein
MSVESARNPYQKNLQIADYGNFDQYLLSLSDIEKTVDLFELQQRVKQLSVD